MRTVLFCVMSLLFGAGHVQADLLFAIDADSDELLTIDSTTAAVTVVGTPDRFIRGIAFDNMGTLYGADRTNNQLVTINTSTAATTFVAPLGSQVRELAFDGGTLYGSIGEDLLTINTATGATTSVGALGVSSIRGLTSDGNGTLYAAEDLLPDPVDLLTINPADATTTTVGMLGDGDGRIGGLVFDSNGTLFGVDNDAMEFLTIDPATGMVTNTIALGRSIRGLVLAPAAVPEPSSLALLCLGGIGLLVGRRRRRSR